MNRPRLIVQQDLHDVEAAEAQANPDGYVSDSPVNNIRRAYVQFLRDSATSRMQAMMEGLSDFERDCLLLSADNATEAEIAAILGRSQPVIHVHLSRAREKSKINFPPSYKIASRKGP